MPSSLNILKKLYSHLNAKRKKQLKVVFAFSILTSFAESMSIAMLIPFVNFYLNSDFYLLNNFFNEIFSFLGINNKKEILTSISFLFILTILLSGFIKLKFIKISNLASENITSDFRIKLFNFLVNQDYNYYFKHGSNEILSNISQKSASLTQIIFSSINIFNSILVTLSIAIILIWNEPFYTPILILFICLFFYVIFKKRKIRVLQKGQITNENQNFLIDIFENAVGYLPEIIIYNLKNFYTSILSKSSKKIAYANAEVKTISMVPRIYLETSILITVIIFISFSDLASRSAMENISYLTILGFGAQKILPMINSVYHFSISFKGATPVVLGYLKILESRQKIITEEINYKSLNFKKFIKIENLSYKYDKTLPKILNNFNLEIFKGDKIAITGKTGAGKSTLTNIISGLLEPTDGKIFVDGVLINSENKKNWQKNISIVPQTIFLNDATILENIAIGINIDQIDIDKVQKCAKLACIDSYIENLPNSYNERVGERGVRLSGGQRQRIGIARSFYRNADLIIMDEPTNALDFETESLIMRSMMNLSKDITIIMISHNEDTLKFFDKIIDLNKLK